jgi:hypothetical protein
MKRSAIGCVRVVGGLSFCLLAACLFFVSLLGVVDPIGAKQADSADPFGVPAPRAFWGVLCLVALALLYVGGYALSRGFIPAADASPNGGPGTLPGNSGASGGPPSVS